jgi:hypothetical protein
LSWDNSGVEICGFVLCLLLWTYAADRSYVTVNMHFPALKTNQTWVAVWQIALDPTQVHVQNGIQRLVSHQALPNRSALYHNMTDRLQNHPPTITIFDYGETDDLSAVDNVRGLNIIFINRTLVKSLEDACVSNGMHLFHHLVTSFYSWHPGAPFELCYLLLPISQTGPLADRPNIWPNAIPPYNDL